MDDVYKSLVAEIESPLQGVEAPPEKFDFEERVKLACFNCSHYDAKWTCPPRNPKLDYSKIFYEYDNGLLVYIEYGGIKKENYSRVRRESSLLVHKALLRLEKKLLYQNYPLAISFIAGSCKLCRNKCSSGSCANPMESRIPLEATGVNLVSSLKGLGIEVSFSNRDSFGRYGLLLW